MRVVRQNEPLRAVTMAKMGGSGQQNDGTRVLTRLLRSNFSSSTAACGVHWQCVTVVHLCGCGLSVFLVELTRLPMPEKLYLDNNKLAS
ncbi:phospholipase A I-like [Argentina anserina]|uniref:phospholipase A I-like n=1 Tax=Argentina anserina TaxID=57926 RepID=UPI0021763F5B|nr:phospholipase A I-like [Potentilla anserina]